MPRRSPAGKRHGAPFRSDSATRPQAQCPNTALPRGSGAEVAERSDPRGAARPPYAGHGRQPLDAERGALATSARPRVGRGRFAQAIGSVLMNGRLSQLLPAATMQLRPLGVVLTTVQVFLSSEA